MNGWTGMSGEDGEKGRCRWVDGWVNGLMGGWVTSLHPISLVLSVTLAAIAMFRNPALFSACGRLGLL